MKFLPIRLACLLSLSLPAAHAASDVSVTTAATSGGNFSGGSPNIFTPSASPAVASNATIQASLNAGTPITLNTVSGAAGNGDLVTTAAISKTAGSIAALTFNAVRDLTLNGTLNSTVGTMPLALTAGRAISSSATVTTNGGNVTINTVQPFALGNSLNAGNGQILLQTGSIESSAMRTVTASSVQVAAGASWKHRGIIAGNLSVAGTLSAGPAAGSLQVNGTLSLQPSATTIVDLAGTSQGSTYDSITATGPVTLAGALQLNFLSGFENTIISSTSFTLISGSSVTGTFTGLANDSRTTLPNDLGSIKISYNATNVVLSDWQLVIRDLTWDSGSTNTGTQVFTIPAGNVGGRHYFRITAEATAVGAWRTALRPVSGTADVYLKQNAFPLSVSDYSYKSDRAGTDGDGFVLASSAFGAAQTWYIMVVGSANAQWSLVSGEAHVQNLGILASDATSSSGNVQIGAEGHRFFRTNIPSAAAAWRVWLNDGATTPATLTSTKLAVRRTAVPMIDDTRDHQQLGHMLLVPPYLNTGGDTYFLAVSGTPGTTINLDSRSAAVTDVAFGSSTAFTLPTAGYAVYRTQVPIDQIGWQAELRGVSANVDLAVRRDNAASEWFNDAFSEVTGTVGDSVTLVPPTLSNGTYYMTVYNSGTTATGTLVNRVPFTHVPDDVPFLGTSLNDEASTPADDANPNKAGWRYFRVGVADAQGISEQLGKFGWELALSGAPANAEIALRRNFLPGRWSSRNAFSGGGQGSTYFQDFSSASGLLPRPTHQADIWYIGIYAPTTAMGNFSLSRSAMVPQTLSFANGSFSTVNQAAGTIRYFIVDIPTDPELLGWDLRTLDATGPVSIGVQLGGPPSPYTLGDSHYWTHSYPRNNWYSHVAVRPTSLVPNSGDFWTGPGTYYIGVRNDTAAALSYTLQSRGIGTAASSYPMKSQPLAFANGTATITDLPARQSAFFTVTVPAGAKTWRLKASPMGSGEVSLMVRRAKIPQPVSYPPYRGLGGYGVELKAPGDDIFYESKGSAADTGNLPAGTYHIMVSSAGTSPANADTVGTGTASAVLTSLSDLPVTALGGGADVAGTPYTAPVSLNGRELQLYSFNVAAGNLSIEVRLNDRVGGAGMMIVPGAYPNFNSPGNAVMAYGGAVPTSAWQATALATLVNPAAGLYTVAVTAGTASASATLSVVANVPQTLSFANGSFSTVNQAAGTIRYFIVDIPTDPELLGWDLRTLDATGPVSIGVQLGGPPSPYTLGDSHYWTHSYPRNNWYSHVAVRPTSLVPNSGDFWTGPGTYYIGVRNDTAAALSYTLQSRGIGTAASSYPMKSQPLAFANGTATITDLPARQSAFFTVTVPAGAKTWRLKASPMGSGEVSLMVRRAKIPQPVSYPPYRGLGGYGVELKAPGDDIFYESKGSAADTGNLPAGTYHIMVSSAGTSPANADTVGTGTASAVLTSLSDLPVTALGGGADVAGTPYTAPVSLNGRELQLYSFNVAAGNLSIEVRLNDRVGGAGMMIVPGAYPNFNSPGNAVMAYGGAVPTSAWQATALATLVNPAAGLYTVAVTAGTASASATLSVMARPPTILNFSVTQNGSGGTNVDTTVTPVSDGTRSFYQITVPSTLNGAAPLGWKLGATITQGAASLYVHRDASNLSAPLAQTTERTLIIAPPVFSPGTYLVELRASGATSYTLTSEAVVPRNAAAPWLLPTAAAYTTADDIGDSGQLDLANGDYDFHVVTVPEGNAGVLRTVIEAISGNPDLYIRRISIPSHHHTVQGPDPDQTVNEIAYSRALANPSGTEYGNWVPYHQKAETQLRPGTYYLAVHAASNTNLRYRLRVSPGAIQSLALDGGNVSSQLLTGGDWRYYKVELPADATMPQSWQMTFAQSSGDAIMFFRDTVPPGLKNTSTVTTYGDATMDWQRDAKNANIPQYSRYDNPGSYTLTTPSLRPGTIYYVGVYAKNDSSFSLTSSKSGNIEATTPLDFYNGTIATIIPGNSSVVYRISAPTEATRLKWTSTHASTVQLRLEQGSLPATTGTVQHDYSSGANSSRNTVLATTWPWLANQNYYLRIVNNAATAASITLAMDGENSWIGSDPYSNWASGVFSSVQLADPSISSGNADSDNDGIANLLEFLFGGNPTSAGASIIPTLTTTPVAGAQTLIFRYNRQLSATGVSQVIEHSSGLSSIWVPAVHGQNGVTITTSPVDAVTQQITVTIPSTGSNRFVRLKASR